MGVIFIQGTPKIFATESFSWWFQSELKKKSLNYIEKLKTNVWFLDMGQKMIFFMDVFDP